jgi:cytochrome b subunit of formate dehydrogenase
LLGGYRVTGVLHRMAATTMLLVFSTHLVRLAHRLLVKKDYGMLWGPRSLVPQPVDLIQLIQHFRWFVGLGPRPHFDRYSYWEKFDYWAVFWGMIVIGFSGYAMWFAPFFAHFLPGWALNAVLVIHSEEGLLAILFIFSIHFVNTHLRPDSFPMDMVVFTGVESEEEFAHKRPLEYERLKREGKLEARLGEAPQTWLINFSRVVGTIAIAIGLTLLVLTLTAYFS